MAQGYKPTGYHKLAQLMGQCDDFAIFRKFNDLNMISLLSFQAELMTMRDEFLSICDIDEKDGKEFSRHFRLLFESKSDPNNFQYSKLLNIRSKMKEYNELLLQVAQINALEKPSKDNYSVLYEWLRDTRGGNAFLQESEAFTWRNEYENDLLTFRGPPDDRDFFTKWLISAPVKFYHKIWGQDPRHTSGRLIDEETGMVSYNEDRVDKVAKTISITLASTLPIVVILGLYFEDSLLKRIYTSIGITAAFAAILSIFTQARRIEIFTATAGLAAVEVVFIGSTARYGIKSG